MEGNKYCMEGNNKYCMESNLNWAHFLTARMLKQQRCINTMFKKKTQIQKKFSFYYNFSQTVLVLVKYSLHNACSSAISIYKQDNERLGEHFNTPPVEVI